MSKGRYNITIGRRADGRCLERKKEKKEEIFIVVGCLLVIVLSVTFAWFSIEIIGESKEVTVDSTDLKIVFTSGSGTILGTDIEPGWSSEVNTFTVKK